MTLEMVRDVRTLERVSKADARDPIPATIPRDGYDRPKIRDAADPTKLRWRYRPSKFADRLGDMFALDRRNDRLVTAGLVRFPDLLEAAGVELARAIRGGEPWDDVVEDKIVKAGLEQIRDQAIERMGGNRRAAAGTAFHEQRHVLDTEGINALPDLTPEDWERLAIWSRMALCFEWHASELFVVCDRWNTAGTLDAVWSPRFPMSPPPEWDMPPLLPGQRVIVDLKSGEWVVQFGQLSQGVQLTQYPNGVPYVHVSDEEARARVDPLDTECLIEGDSGRREWPDGIAPRTDVALIPHVPHDHPEDAGLYWVDLRLGARMSDCAAEVWAIRKLAPQILAPCELPPEALELGETIPPEVHPEPEGSHLDRALELVAEPDPATWGDGTPLPPEPDAEPAPVSGLARGPAARLAGLAERADQAIALMREGATAEQAAAAVASFCPAHPGAEPNFYGRCPFDHHPDGSCWHNSRDGVSCEYCGATVTGAPLEMVRTVGPPEVAEGLAEPEPAHCAEHPVALVSCDACSAASHQATARKGAPRFPRSTLVARPDPDLRRAHLSTLIRACRVPDYLDRLRRDYADVWGPLHDQLEAERRAEL